MTPAETAFPAEEVVAGRLRLSGSDALGPNPWTAPRPTPEAHGLAAADLDEYRVAHATRLAERELRQLSARVFSSFLVPVLAIAAAYWWFVGKIDLSTLPPYEWVTYLGASLVLAAIAARMQTAIHNETKREHEHLVSVGDRRTSYRAGERNWRDEQKRRTTAAFWVDDIPKIAAEKELPPGTVFAQEAAKLFVAWTWNVKLNQRRHDYGVDIFARGKEGSAVILCEHTVEAGLDAPRVRDLAGSRHAFGADYGLLISIHPQSATPQTDFFSDKGQLELWHLGHVLEQCIVLYKQRTGEDAPEDDGRLSFLNPDGTPIMRHAEEHAAAAE